MHGFQQGGLAFRAQLYPVTPAFHREINELRFLSRLYVRTKVRNLLALGTSKRQAIMTGLSSKSYWHLSRTLATQTGMTNDWLKSQGLISVRDLWMKVHGYA